MFIPHNGCPNKCSFCDQRYITGLKHQVNEKEVKDILNRAKKDLEGKQDNSEIAFFGGSFTAIDRDYMLSLLNVAFEFVKDGSFSGIRISTRPDAIDCEILDILKEKGVSVIQLAQKMGVTRSACYQYINGNPTAECLERIALALDVEIGELFDIQKDKTD